MSEPWLPLFDGIDRTIAQAGLILDGGAMTPEVLEEAARLILDTPPLPPCGMKGNPHLLSPRPTRWPVCVTCGAGCIDAAVDADMEAKGIDTSTWPNIAGKTVPVP